MIIHNLLIAWFTALRTRQKVVYHLCSYLECREQCLFYIFSKDRCLQCWNENFGLFLHSLISPRYGSALIRVVRFYAQSLPALACGLCRRGLGSRHLLSPRHAAATAGSAPSACETRGPRVANSSPRPIGPMTHVPASRRRPVGCCCELDRASKQAAIAASVGRPRQASANRRHTRSYNGRGPQSAGLL